MEESLLVKIHQHVPFHIAALVEPLAVALHAISKADMDRQVKVLVIGAGPIGALIHCVLKIKGFNQAYITDVSEYRRQAVEGAFPGSVVEPRESYDLVFETTGSAAVVTNVLPEVMHNKCTLVMVGLFRDAVSFDFTQLVEKEWNVHGCAAFSSELRDAAVLLDDNWEKFDHIVSHRLPLSDYQSAFDILLDARKEAVKIVFLP